MDDVVRLARAIANERTRWMAVRGPGDVWFVTHFDPVTSNRPIEPHGGAFRTREDAMAFIESRVAQAAIEALTAAGWRKVGPDEVVVPREPTAEMVEAWRLRMADAEDLDFADGLPAPVTWHENDWRIDAADARSNWRVMVDASQTQENGDG